MRIVANSFIGGELSPSLFGRHDIQAYFHSAQKIKNFTVQKTGGLKKRAGTQLLWEIKAFGGEAKEFRIFPFFYDRTRYLGIAFYTKKNQNYIYYRVCEEGKSPYAEYTLPIATLAAGKTLADYKIKQIGDTLFFSCLGTRSFTGKVYYEERASEDAILWEEFQDEIDVQDAPELSLEVDGFESDETQGFRPAVRKYALFGVKNGVYSTPFEKDANIYLYWVAGATVTLSFTPQWDKHDYYILSVQQGGSWGVLYSFYPKIDDGEQSDTTWTSAASPESTVTVNGTVYLSEGTVAGLSEEGNELTTGTGENPPQWSTNSVFLAVENSALTGDYKPSETSPVLGLRFWWGAKLRRNAEQTTVDTVSTGLVNISLYMVDKDGVQQEDPIAEWKNVNTAYSEQPMKLTVADPVPGIENGKYRLIFETPLDEDGETPLYTDQKILLRGIAILSDSATQTFVDNNIEAGSLAGEQELLTVGDSGMDCSVIDVWEQRLVMASSKGKPFTIWFSQVGDVYNFYTNRPVTMSDAFSASIPATVASRILHILTNRWMLLFTESGEYSVGTVGNSGFAFNTISIKKTSGVGCHDKIEPVATEDKALFVAPDGKTVYEIKYSLEQDNIIPTNRSVLASHLTEGRSVKKIVYERFPEPTLYCLLEDYTIAAMTYLPEQNVFAWYRMEFSYPGLRCIDINAPTSIYDSDSHETSSTILLTFTHASKPGYAWVERLRANIVSDSATIGDAKCCDHCGYSAAQYPVSGEDPETPVNAELVTMRPELPDFNSIGQKKNLYDCVFRLRRSGTLKVRPYGDDLEYADSGVQETASPVVEGENVTLVTKDVKILPRAYHNTDGQMQIVSNDIYPCEILSILFNLEVADMGQGG